MDAAVKLSWYVALAAFGVVVGAPTLASTVLAAHPASVCSDHAAEAAARAGLGVDVIMRVMRAESGGDARAVSPKGALGCMQIMPLTWADLTARYALGPDPFDARLNMIGGAFYLAELTRRFGPAGAYAAYNAGPARYIRYVAGGALLPAETIAYVARMHGKPVADLSVPARVRWQAASLFLAHVDSAETEGSRTVSHPMTVTRFGALDPASQASASRVKASQTLFPLLRNKPLPQAH